MAVAEDVVWLIDTAVETEDMMGDHSVIMPWNPAKGQKVWRSLG
jgi:hypothetical protein